MTKIAAPSSARRAAAQALTPAAKRFPDLDPTPLDTGGLSERDRGLALAVHRTVLQRWITLEYLLDQHLRQPMHALEPALRAVLLTGAAQLLFMDRLPVHAVVDESVTMARELVRPQAAGLVNAVLRKVAGLAENAVTGQAWTPGVDRLPTTEGFVPLREPCLPDPKKDFAGHLSVATSHPETMVENWLAQFGREQTLALCRHGLQTPPVIVAVEEGFSSSGKFVPHSESGYLVWEGSHRELTAFLTAHPARRVQDPAAGRAVAMTAGLKPARVMDFCAGRGTKAKQLAAMHRDAVVMAHDVNRDRLADLRRLAGLVSNVKVVEPSAVGGIEAGSVDLLVLDVPCSNTAVLARRAEARYRFSRSSIRELVALQRKIIESSLRLVAPSGHVLFSTCSLDRRENQEQVAWLSERHKVRALAESFTLPGGIEATYHDGGYAALLRAAP